MVCDLKYCLKSALAFFFLFFLHGTSFGSGQQGITHNGLQICEGWDFYHKIKIETQNYGFTKNII